MTSPPVYLLPVRCQRVLRASVGAEAGSGSDPGQLLQSSRARTLQRPDPHAAGPQQVNTLLVSHLSVQSSHGVNLFPVSGSRCLQIFRPMSDVRGESVNSTRSSLNCLFLNTTIPMSLSCCCYREETVRLIQNQREI